MEGWSWGRAGGKLGGRGGDRLKDPSAGSQPPQRQSKGRLCARTRHQPANGMRRWQPVQGAAAVFGAAGTGEVECAECAAARCITLTSRDGQPWRARGRRLPCPSRPIPCCRGGALFSALSLPCRRRHGEKERLEYQIRLALSCSQSVLAPTPPAECGIWNLAKLRLVDSFVAL